MKKEKQRGRVFGLKCLELLARYSPSSHSWKMAQLSLFGEEQESLQTLPKSALMQNGKLYRQGAIKIPRSERGTTEQGSGLWHTPTTMASPSYEKRYPGGKERKHPIPNLPAEVQEGVPYSISSKLRGEKLWLTPGTVQISPKQGRRNKRVEFRKSIGRKDNPGCLEEQVMTEKFHPKMFPTPETMLATG